MFAGKTSELRRQLLNYIASGFKCCVIRYEYDKRFEKITVNGYELYRKVLTHNKEVLDFPTITVKYLKDIDDNELARFDVIGIDEGQFFPDIVAFCEKYAFEKKKIVIVTCLNGDSDRKPWDNISQLLGTATSIVCLNGFCRVCHGVACFSKCLKEKKQKEEVGGDDMYIAVCAKCFFDKDSTFILKQE